MKLNTTFTDATLETDDWLDAKIKARASYGSWIQPNDGRINLVGSKLGQLFDYKSTDTGGTTVHAQQGTDGNRPTYAPGQLNGYHGAIFDGVDDWMLYLPAWTRGAPWSLAAVYKPDPTSPDGEPRYLVSAWDSGAVGSGIAQKGDVVEFHHGNAALVMPAVRGQAHCVVMSSDTTTIRGRVDGVAGTPVVTNNAVPASPPVVGALNTSGGLPFKGTLLDLLLFSTDIITQDPALLGYVETNMARVYGLPFQPFVA